jgi:hypothetical protein
MPEGHRPSAPQWAEPNIACDLSALTALCGGKAAQPYRTEGGRAEARSIHPCPGLTAPTQSPRASPAMSEL